MTALVPKLVASALLLLALPSHFIQAQERHGAIVDAILSAWNTADVVCLVEHHGRQYDSDLRIALVRHPAFAKTVRVVVVEFANPVHQDLLDRFILDGAPMLRDELAVIWRDANGAEVWESPICEQFLRAVQEVNLGLPNEQRVRVVGGDSRIDWSRVTRAEDLVPLVNRGGNIRNIIAQVLGADLKGLAIYGAGHCRKVGGGFPGDLAGRYAEGRIWSIWPVLRDKGAEHARLMFGLGDQPAYIQVAGTEWAATASGELLFTEPRFTLGQVLDALVYHGAVRDGVARADLTQFSTAYGAELARRRQLMAEALTLWRRRP